jgi:hypothetical protein
VRKRASAALQMQRYGTPIHRYAGLYIMSTGKTQIKLRAARNTYCLRIFRNAEACLQLVRALLCAGQREIPRQ